MTINIDRKAVIGASICLGAVIFALGAGSPATESAPAKACTPPKWAICGVPNSAGDAYVVNQENGNLYYMSRKQSTTSTKMKFNLVGNLNDAE
jgi:hypothetical protein